MLIERDERFLRFLQPAYLYLAVVFGWLAFLFFAIVDFDFDAVGTTFFSILGVGVILIYIAPAIGFRTFAKPVTAKVIAIHFSVMATLAFFVADFVGGNGYYLIDIIVSLWPIQFVADRMSDDFLKLGLFAVFLALLVNLRKKLVAEQVEGESPAALSIYPDPATYVDDDGYEAGVARLISRSNGGVVGITGVRGAGKSALLAKIRARFQDQYCVVWTVAPVSQRDDDDLSFLMSICRTLCQKAIDDAREVLYGRRNSIQQAGEEFLRRIRIPSAVLAILVGSLLLLDTTGLQAPLFAERLAPPKNFRLGDNSIRFNAAGANSSFSEAVSAERTAIRGLIARIDAVLPEQIDTSSDQSFAIVPLVRHRGFDLILGDTSTVDPDVFLENHDWLADDVRTKSDVDQVKNEVRGLDDFVYRDDAPFDEKRKIQQYFGQMFQSQDEATVTAAVAFHQLQKLFHRQITGETKSFYLVDSSTDLDPSFEYRLIALTMLRGYPGLEIHLGAQTADLKALLKITNKGVQHTEWASILLLAAYLDRIAPLLDKDVAADKRKDLAAELFMDADTLRRLRGVLARYLEMLNGKTLTAGLSDAGSAAKNAPRGFGESVLARTGELDARIAWPFLAILLFAVLPELWRAGNFVLRGLLNYQLLVLVRESDEFLETLHFSEGREASAGFSFRGLFNLAGKRTLTARTLTLQSLTDHYQTYVKSLLTHYNGKLIVIIDELDKMVDPEDVKKVLLELKGALFQGGCYYLISISEDCAKAFRGRLIEGRDIFESTFEDVIAIRQMAPSTARAMVGNRLETDESAPKLSNAAIDVLTVFAGAIPREIVRHLRDTVLNAEGRKSISHKSIGRDIFRTELNQWMDQLRTAPYAGEQLIALREHCQDMLDALPKSMKQDWPDQNSERVINGAAKSIGVVLAGCLEILDPDGQWRSNEIIGALEIPTDAESRNRFRRLAELQACLRLMIMNELMRHIWRTNKLDDDQSQSAITCFRTVMLHPAIAEQMLSDLAIEKLGQTYPEDKPTQNDSTDIVDAAAE